MTYAARLPEKSRDCDESEDSSPKSGKWGRRRNLKKKPPRPPGKGYHKKEERKKGEICAWLLWKDRRTPSRPKLSSIRTTVFEVWQVQPL